MKKNYVDIKIIFVLENLKLLRVKDISKFHCTITNPFLMIHISMAMISFIHLLNKLKRTTNLISI